MMTLTVKAVAAVLCATLAVTSAEAGLFGGKLTLVEPLFGPKYEACLKDPLMLMRSMGDKPLYDQSSAGGELEPLSPKERADQRRESQMRARCIELEKGFANFKPPLTVSQRSQDNQRTPLPIGPASIPPYKVDEEIAMRRRNELIDALVAVSDNKCSTYSAYLKTFDGRNNSVLGILGITTAGLGSFVGGAATAKALSGASAIINGSRSALNEVWFSSQTIHVLAAAYENARQKERQEITNRQACGIKTYTLSHGIGDAIHYHGACSLLTGLAETSLAVARQDEPGLDAMRRQLADIQSIRNQAADLLPPPTSGQSTNSMLKQQQVVAAESEARELKRLFDAANTELKAANDAVVAAHEGDAPQPTEKQMIDFLAADSAVQKASKAATKAETNYKAARTDADALRTELIQLVADEQKSSQIEAVRQARLVRDVSHVAICPYGRNGGIDEESEDATKIVPKPEAKPTPLELARKKIAKKA